MLQHDKTFIMMCSGERVELQPIEAFGLNRFEILCFLLATKHVKVTPVDQSRSESQYCRENERI